MFIDNNSTKYFIVSYTLISLLPVRNVWKYFIKSYNQNNGKNFDAMLHQIGTQWKLISSTTMVRKPTINDVTKVFKVAYKLIWQAAFDNDMCTIIPLSHKMDNQNCRNSYYMNNEIIELLDTEIELINSQNNLIKQMDKNNTIVQNDKLQFQVEQLTTQLIDIRKSIRQKQVEAINHTLDKMYDKDDHNKISKFYKLLKGDSTYDFYGIEIKEDGVVTLDKIQIMEQIQKIFGTLFRDPSYTTHTDHGKLNEMYNFKVIGNTI